MSGLPGSRGWEKSDEHNDRGVTEEPVTDEEIEAGNSHGNAHVDAVPGCWWRPGSRN